ncbi:MAG TPA: cyclic nucleotide-binding domain-containing protein [Candidatus Binatia bacterium]|jgi:CRP-like cAMP-binding protein|nr:cyclic nucleotide-binding domain-containing protein [Candidatus Binatia bacterium]
MKAFNWSDLFKGHSVFASLSEADIEKLLEDEASQERAYPAGDVVVKEGELGDSLFFIGSGSVQVTLQGPGGQSIPLATLEAREFFGEVAVLERRPRSATVTAREKCLLLEISGDEFRKLLETHPELQSQVYAKMRARLGQSSPQ